MASRTATDHARNTASPAPGGNRRVDRNRRPGPGRAARAARRSPGQSSRREYTQLGAHPRILKIGLGASLWFLAVIWLAFSWSSGMVLPAAIATTFLIVSFGTALLSCSYIRGDPRWHTRYVNFARFLHGWVSIETGPIRGRAAAVQILLLPVSLAVAMTLFGVVWIAVS